MNLATAGQTIISIKYSGAYIAVHTEIGIEVFNTSFIKEGELLDPLIDFFIFNSTGILFSQTSNTGVHFLSFGTIIAGGVYSVDKNYNTLSVVPILDNQVVYLSQSGSSLVIVSFTGITYIPDISIEQAYYCVTSGVNVAAIDGLKNKLVIIKEAFFEEDLPTSDWSLGDSLEAYSFTNRTVVNGTYTLKGSYQEHIYLQGYINSEYHLVVLSATENSIGDIGSFTFSNSITPYSILCANGLRITTVLFGSPDFIYIYLFDPEAKSLTLEATAEFEIHSAHTVSNGNFINEYYDNFYFYINTGGSLVYQSSMGNYQNYYWFYSDVMLDAILFKDKTTGVFSLRKIDISTGAISIVQTFDATFSDLGSIPYVVWARNYLIVYDTSFTEPYLRIILVKVSPTYTIEIVHEYSQQNMGYTSGETTALYDYSDTALYSIFAFDGLSYGYRINPTKDTLEVYYNLDFLSLGYQGFKEDGYIVQKAAGQFYLEYKLTFDSLFSSRIFLFLGEKRLLVTDLGIFKFEGQFTTVLFANILDAQELYSTLSGVMIAYLINRAGTTYYETSWIDCV